MVHEVKQEVGNRKRVWVVKNCTFTIQLLS